MTDEAIQTCMEIEAQLLAEGVVDDVVKFLEERVGQHYPVHNLSAYGSIRIAARALAKIAFDSNKEMLDGSVAGVELVEFQVNFVGALFGEALVKLTLDDAK